MNTFILLVDDNGIQGMSRKAILDRSFSGVSISDSPLRALALMSDSDFLRTLKLVITDHLMPQMNGPEFVRELRRLRPELPVLVLSGMPDAETEYEGLDVTFRMKPFAPEQLVALTEDLLSDAEDENMSRTA
jgi:DNA-binding NtrC family response regulator